MNDPNTSQYMRPVQAAAYLGLSKSFLDKLRVCGGGPRYAKVGRSVVYRREWLGEWMETRQRCSTSEMAKAA